MAEKFRIIQVDEPQPWVTRLSEADRADYEQARQENITEIADVFVDRLQKFLDKVEKLGPDVAIVEGALAIATAMRNQFEAGIQIGEEAATARLKPRMDEDAMFRYNVANQLNSF